MKTLDDVFPRLARSAFRRRFHLAPRDREYFASRGLPTILEHAREFVAKRLAPAQPVNDGKQTPFRGHPVFVAQHATATCCRGCLEKWHGVVRGYEMSAEEQAYAVRVIERWLREETRA